MLLSFLIGPVLAQNSQSREVSSTIVSDRPGLGDGAWVIGPGLQQFEMGATLSDSGPDRFGVGSGVLRAGLADFELRLALPSVQFDSDSGESEYGDLGVGFKAPISDGSWRVSAIGGVTLPTGSDGATADEVTGALAILGETALTDRTGLTINVGAAMGEDSDTTLILIPTLSRQLTPKVSGYAGFGGFFADEQDQHWIEGGFAINAGADLQWDLNSAYDLENDQWFVGIGFSWRRLGF
ncbi:MAG: transporter [Pseudomonadota bacterium]